MNIIHYKNVMFTNLMITAIIVRGLLSYGIWRMKKEVTKYYK